MGLFSFLKSAGEKLFGGESAEEKAEKVVEHLQGYGLDTKDITVSVDDDIVTVGGSVDTLEQKNKILVAAGNIKGISDVNDKLAVNTPIKLNIEPAKMFYVVKKGDYLSKIAKKVYGDWKRYEDIFEANKPMLSHPDKIYPGQVLVIPPQKEQV